MPPRRLSRLDREEYDYKPSKIAKRDVLQKRNALPRSEESPNVVLRPGPSANESSNTANHCDKPMNCDGSIHVDEVANIINTDMFPGSDDDAEELDAEEHCSELFTYACSVDEDETNENTQTAPSDPIYSSDILGLKYEHLVALILTSGTNRLTETMYEVIRSLLNSVALQHKYRRNYPGVSTVKQRVREIATSRCFVKTQTISLPNSGKKSVTSFRKGTKESSSHSLLKYILPSQWASMDVRLKSTRDIIWNDTRDSSRQPHETIFSQFRDSPVARNRVHCFNLFSILDEDGNDIPVRENLQISIHSVNMATTRKAFEKYGIEVLNAKTKEQKVLLWRSSVKSYKLIRDAPMEYSGKRHSY